MKHLVFLGNPGKEYATTRHNAGFMIGEALAVKLGAQWEKRKNFLVARGADNWLVKPQTFMNLSGEALKWLPDFRRDELLIVVDDLALPLGKLRFRESGSAGGHNGLKSIAAALGDDNYQRLRFGVGDGGEVRGEKMLGQVLGNFSPLEREQLPALYEAAADACRDWLNNGIKFCQDRYHSINN
ncbi:MAG: aminoacyl-tRNA hydrolase [Planctomycetota bacterium]|nr:aminoacyl-tRNA hydrolase [Planctomycetota bacterium]